MFDNEKRNGLGIAQPGCFFSEDDAEAMLGDYRKVLAVKESPRFWALLAKLGGYQIIKD